MELKLGELYTAFLKVAGPQEALVAPVFERLTAHPGGTSRAPLLEYQAGGKAILHPDHPVYALYQRSRCAGKEYYLISALLSVVNRAERLYEDSHEREFHGRLLEYLLEA